MFLWFLKADIWENSKEMFVLSQGETGTPGGAGDIGFPGSAVITDMFFISSFCHRRRIVFTLMSDFVFRDQEGFQGHRDLQA